MAHKVDYKATLADFDKREVEIVRTLSYLKNTLPSREYKRIEAKYVKELTQMNTRRPILQAFERRELVNEVKDAFKVCGILVESSDTSAIQT